MSQQKWEKIEARETVRERSNLVVILGIIVPPVNVSTRTMNGIMDKTLWCDENGVSQ